LLLSLVAYISVTDKWAWLLDAPLRRSTRLLTQSEKRLEEQQRLKGVNVKSVGKIRWEKWEETKVVMREAKKGSKEREIIEDMKVIRKNE